MIAHKCGCFMFRRKKHCDDEIERDFVTITLCSVQLQIKSNSKIENVNQANRFSSLTHSHSTNGIIVSFYFFFKSSKVNRQHNPIKENETTKDINI